MEALGAQNAMTSAFFKSKARNCVRDCDFYCFERFFNVFYFFCIFLAFSAFFRAEREIFLKNRDPSGSF